MRKYLVVVDRNRSSKGTRFANFIIDRFIITLIFLPPDLFHLYCMNWQTLTFS